MRLRQKLELADPLVRRDRSFVDFDFVKRDFRLGKMRSSQLLSLPGVTYTGGAGFKMGYDAADNLVGPFPANDPGLTDRGVGIWRAATNLTPHSAEPSDATWVYQQGTPTTGQADPFGGTAAVLFTPNGINAAHLVAGPGSAFTSGSSYTIARLVKPGTATRLQLTVPMNRFSGGAYANFLLTGAGSVTSTGGAILRSGVKQLAGGWYLIWVAAACDITGNGEAGFVAVLVTGSETRAPSVTTSGTYTEGGAQAELGLAVSPFIITGAAAATRTADSLRLSLSRLPLTSEYSVQAEWEVQHTEAASYAFQIENANTGATGRNTHYMGRNGSGTPVMSVQGDASLTMLNGSTASPITTPGTILRGAGSVSLTAPPTGAVNGSLMGGATAADIMLGVNLVVFGNPHVGSNECLTGYLRRFVLTPRRRGPGVDIARSRL